MTRPMIVFHQKGDWTKTDNWLRRARKMDPMTVLNRWGLVGVDRLREATPKRTGLTSESWSYNITKGRNGYTIEWRNSNMTETGEPIVILLQYGHGTKNGMWVEGRDFINPSLQPIFDKIVKDLWKGVMSI